MGSRDPVGRTAKCQVTSERKPGFVARTVVDEIAERLLLERHVIIYFPPASFSMMAAGLVAQLSKRNYNGIRGFPAGY